MEEVECGGGRPRGPNLRIRLRPGPEVSPISCLRKLVFAAANSSLIISLSTHRRFCDAPASVHPYEWPDDITKWPICRKTNTQFSIQKRSGSRDKSAEHMICEVIGHPCCIGIHGQCKITTKEYCDFVRGAFHEEASLCSQVKPRRTVKSVRSVKQVTAASGECILQGARKLVDCLGV